MTEICNELLEFMEGQPNNEVRGEELGEFYKFQGEDAKNAISNCRVPGHKNGIRSFCATFPDKLAYRKLDTSLVIMRAADLDKKDDATRMAVKLAMAYDGSRDDSGKSALEIIENELAALKLELGSMTKLAKEVQSRGICLRDGSEHGANLRAALRKGKALTVSKELAKGYAHARKCMIVAF